MAGAALVACASPASAAKSSEQSSRITRAVEAVQSAVPSVVNISTERVIRVADPFESFFNDFFGGPSRYYRETVPLGSGIIVDGRGLFLTNRHVVQRASKITIHLWNGESCSAQYVAGDSANDLALLRIDEGSYSGKLHAGTFATPDDLMLGETVLAVGNPFGLEHSVTSGVLSARNRSLREGGMVFDDILQTDAAINPGNSGGPLLNVNGEIIGINVAIRSDAEGIGFAIPVRRIESVLAKWLVPSRFSRSVCGFVPATIIDESGVTSATIAEVIPGTPAASAGLTADSRIASINGTRVSRAVDVGRVLWPLKEGDRVSVVLDGAAGAVDFAMSESSREMLVERRLGLQLQPLTPALIQALEVPSDMRGLIVSDVIHEHHHPKNAIQRGDILVGIGQTPTETLEDVIGTLENKAPGETVPVTVFTIQSVHGRRFLQRLVIDIRLE